MFYREFLPERGLRHAIKCYWFLSGTLDVQQDDRILPDGCSELIFHCGDTFHHRRADRCIEQPRTLLIGPSTRAMTIRPGHTVDVIGVRFRPGGLALLGGPPPALVRDRSLDAGDAGVQLPPHLLERVAELRTDDERRTVLDNMFSARYASARFDVSMQALQYCIVAGGGEVRTRFLTQLTGLSVRQIQRRFLAATGVSPKLLSRLVRFQRALAAAQRPGRTLAAVAAAAGYADQAHFTREFREFVGVSPGEHFRAAGELSNYFVERESEL